MKDNSAAPVSDVINALTIRRFMMNSPLIDYLTIDKTSDFLRKPNLINLVDLAV
jgi:hypothetical protein